MDLPRTIPVRRSPLREACLRAFLGTAVIFLAVPAILLPTIRYCVGSDLLYDFHPAILFHMLFWYGVPPLVIFVLLAAAFWAMDRGLE